MTPKASYEHLMATRKRQVPLASLWTLGALVFAISVAMLWFVWRPL